MLEKERDDDDDDNVSGGNQDFVLPLFFPLFAFLVTAFWIRSRMSLFLSCLLGTEVLPLLSILIDVKAVAVVR
jgi:hypothetical protein